MTVEPTKDDFILDKIVFDTMIRDTEERACDPIGTRHKDLMSAFAQGIKEGALNPSLVDDDSETYWSFRRWAEENFLWHDACVHCILAMDKSGD